MGVCSRPIVPGACAAVRSGAQKPLMNLKLENICAYKVRLTKTGGVFVFQYGTAKKGDFDLYSFESPQVRWPAPLWAALGRPPRLIGARNARRVAEVVQAQSIEEAFGRICDLEAAHAKHGVPPELEESDLKER